jgi:signal transduction histidine kinase
MPTETVNPRWPEILSLTAHEFRSPLTVVAGYLRMLLRDSAGPVTDQQRRLLEHAENSCNRLSALVAEVSELSKLEGGSATFNRRDLNLRELLHQVTDALPPPTERDIKVELETASGRATVAGDAARLSGAFTSLILGLRRELVRSDRLLIRESVRQLNGTKVSWIAIGDEGRIDSLSTAELPELTTFDEWRGGCGLSLAIARRIITAHDGEIWSPADAPKAGAALAIPLK